MMYTWRFGVLLPYMGALGRGLLATLLISGASILVGSALGVILAVARRSAPRPLAVLTTGFTELFLAMPVLVLLVWSYYCLPLIAPVRLSAMMTTILVFTLSLSAFISEIVRAGIEAVPVGQIQAGLSLRLNRIGVYRFIVLPQALRAMLPALLTQYLTTLKLSTLASVIAVHELLHTAGSIVAHTYRPLEVYSAVAVVFIAVILPINILTRRLERRWGHRWHSHLRHS